MHTFVIQNSKLPATDATLSCDWELLLSIFFSLVWCALHGNAYVDLYYPTLLLICT